MPPANPLAHLAYEQLAQVGQALAHSVRLRILNFLAQREQSVEELAAQLDQSVANTSAHLKVLRQVHLVSSRRDGRHVLYSVAGVEALRLFLALRDLGRSLLPELRHEAQRLVDEEALFVEGLDASALLSLLSQRSLTLLDLRPEEEFHAGHIPGARSLPMDHITPETAASLPHDLPVFAYCRGPYCIGAIRGVERLREAGLDARFVPFGMAEWRVEGLPVALPPAREEAPEGLDHAHS